MHADAVLEKRLSLCLLVLSFVRISFETILSAFITRLINVVEPTKMN